MQGRLKACALTLHGVDLELVRLAGPEVLVQPLFAERLEGNVQEEQLPVDHEPVVHLTLPHVPVLQPANDLALGRHEVPSDARRLALEEVVVRLPEVVVDVRLCRCRREERAFVL